MLRKLNRAIFFQPKSILQRSLSHYPIDETIFGLNEEQIKVRFIDLIAKYFFVVLSGVDLFIPIQLRETVFNFAQKELAPHAQDIDRKNEFKSVYLFGVEILLLRSRIEHV